ncbi:hypothetical protein CLU79DRAFT_871668, partial [Phycomyces nitens]
MNDYMDLNTDEAEAGSILIALANHSSHSGGYAEGHKVRSVYNHQKIKQEEQPQSVSGNSMSIRNLLGDEDRKPLPLNFEKEGKHAGINGMGDGKETSFHPHLSRESNDYSNAMRDDSDRVQSTHRYPTAPAYIDIAQHNIRTEDYHRNLEANPQYPQDTRATSTNGRQIQPPNGAESAHHSAWQPGSADQYSRPPKVHTNRRASVPPNARVEPSNGYSQQFVNMKIHKQQQFVEMSSSYPSGFQPNCGYTAPAQDPQNRQSWHAYSQQPAGPKQTVHASEKPHYGPNYTTTTTTTITTMDIDRRSSSSVQRPTEDPGRQYAQEYHHPGFGSRSPAPVRHSPMTPTPGPPPQLKAGMNPISQIYQRIPPSTSTPPPVPSALPMSQPPISPHYQQAPNNVVNHPLTAFLRERPETPSDHHSPRPSLPPCHSKSTMSPGSGLSSNPSIFHGSSSSPLRSLRNGE